MRLLSPNTTRLQTWRTAALLAVGLSFLSGCVVEEHPRREVIVEPAPVAGEEVIVTAPPPLREEVIVERPSPEHVWVHGYWAWRGGRHVWVGGRWELPPHPGYVWVEPRWEARSNGYVFVAGNWRAGAVVAAPVAPGVDVRVNFVAQPPPPVRHEVVVERTRPSRDHVWIEGYWRWRDGHHVWIGGHWERPPHPHMVWIAPRWEHRREGYVFIEGYWH